MSIIMFVEETNRKTLNQSVRDNVVISVMFVETRKED